MAAFNDFAFDIVQLDTYNIDWSTTATSTDGSLISFSYTTDPKKITARKIAKRLRKQFDPEQIRRELEIERIKREAENGEDVVHDEGTSR